MSTRSRLSVPVLTILVLLMAACSGGGDTASEDDATAPAAGVQSVQGERAVQFEGAGKAKLFGTFSMPATQSGASVPGVLLVPTSGAGGLLGGAGVNDPLGKDMAKTFSDAGVASYRYDQRGTGSSRLEPDVRLSFDDLVADARAGLDLLAQRRETNGRELAVVGYDQGGLVALRLAATDARVKRVILISTPGRSLVDVRASQLQARYGPEGAAALRAEVANLIATRSLPPLDQLRTELRPLLPAQEAGFLADLYGLDPAVDAAKVRVPTMIVVPSDPAPYDPQRLAAAIPGAQVVNSLGSGSTLVISGPTPEDLSDPTSANHEHGAGPPVGATTRDTAALDRVARFTGATP
ncbi:MAG TPA: alpha/beta fold hydrolase [Acidimicrobiales bacterium]|nr:alpha/beta fold hydrolase [Acidimicrobiales bacterium]